MFEKLSNNREAVSIEKIEKAFNKKFTNEGDADNIKITCKMMVQTTSAYADNKFTIKDNMVSYRVYKEIMEIHSAFTASDMN